MLPYPDSLALPLKEGIRDLRSSIRHEARAGSVSNQLFGTPEPTRRLARLADGVLTRAERFAGKVLSRSAADLGARLDRLGAGLLQGHVTERTGDVYAVCQAICDLDGPSGAVVSELKLSSRNLDRPLSGEGDTALAAVRIAARMAALDIVRPCLGTVLASAGREETKALNARVALTAWLAVLVRLQTREDARVILASARWATEAEEAEWLALLNARRFDDLAALWRQTVPYLP
jgi:hypothetical protein